MKGNREVKNVNSLKSALVVVGGSIAVTPAFALELGEVKVHSSLGQPLRASISYALGANEAISDSCVTLTPSAPGAGLPSVDKGSMIVTDGVIAITGNAVIREPMMTMRVSIRCPYTPQLIRDYLLFIDPAEPQGAPIAAPTAAQVATQPQLAQPPVIRQATPARPQPAAQAPIRNASRYQVQPGDSLSEIVQRIENRPVGLWPAVNAIFAANPDAFLDNDPNKLKAGAWLTIPSFGADAPLAVAEAPAPATVDSPASVADPVVPDAGGTVYEPASVPAPAPVAENPVAVVAAPVEATVAEEPLADLQPGDVIVNTDNPYVESVGIPDTQLEGPETTSSSPNVPVAVIRQPATEEASGGFNWLLWLGSAGFALILGLLLFGRRLRHRFGSAPIAPVVPQRRATDVDTEKVEAIAEPDMDIADDSPTAENLALDADLVIGTGLQEGADVDVASDFAFDSTTQLDIELTEEMASDEHDDETDIIPPINTGENSILESEVLPEDDDDDYDMSVIVDATKMPDPEDVTERDLEAIAVDDEDETLITGDYTVSQEVDYKILEQDYEDEMTATQALNAEIQKAAEDLAIRMDDDEPAEDETAQMPLATVHELDVTAQLPRDESAEAISDDDDTGVNPTVNIEADDKTVEMTDEGTVEMPKKGGEAG
jgi:hypothetical protein